MVKVQFTLSCSCQLPHLLYAGLLNSFHELHLFLCLIQTIKLSLKIPELAMGGSN